MATSLSRQVAGIAATSTKPLDLKAQRQAHSQSLLFEPKVAATQGFDVIYDYCVEGYQEICRLDPRFTGFSTTIFSEASKTQERGQLTASENKELDFVLERFLILSCGHILLQPTQKALEWVIRRFRVHEHNTETLVLSFLIYHPLPIFSTLLSILPQKLPRSLKFLGPYRERLQPPSSDVLQHATSTNTAFFDKWTDFVLKSCKWRSYHEPMLSYWTIQVATSVEKQLGPSKTGGAQAQIQREEDVIRKFATVLNQGLVFRKIPSMIVGCYIIIQRMVLAANLNDEVVSTFMDAIATAATKDVQQEALVALCSLMLARKSRQLSRSTLKFLLAVTGLRSELTKLPPSVRSGRLAVAVILNLIDQRSDGISNADRQLVSDFFAGDFLSDEELEVCIHALMKTNSDEDASISAASGLSIGWKSVLLQFAKSESSPRTSNAVQRILESNLGLDQTTKAAIETVLHDSEIRPETSAIGDIQMTDTEIAPMQWVDLLPQESSGTDSYLSRKDETFEKLASAFSQLPKTTQALEEFSGLAFLRRADASRQPTFVTFFARYWSLPYDDKSRARAIRCVTDNLDGSVAASNLQMVLPYILLTLADTSQVVRNAAADLLVRVSQLIDEAKESYMLTWNFHIFYGSSEHMQPITQNTFHQLVKEILLPDLEAFKLDHFSVGRCLRDCLSGTTSTNSESSKLKKVARGDLLKFLASHARATPVLRVKAALLKITSGIQKSGLEIRFEAFKPMLADWVSISDESLQKACEKEKLDIKSFCTDAIHIVPPTSVEANQTLRGLSTKIVSRAFLDAAADYISSSWLQMSAIVRSDWAEHLFQHGVLSRGKSLIDNAALALLGSLQLSSDILECFVSEVSVSLSEFEVSSPSAKRRKLAAGTATTDSAPAELITHIHCVTLLLDLVRTAGSAAGYTLLPGLFRIFQNVNRAKGILENDLTYVHWLLLTCLRDVVVNTQRADLSKLDHRDLRIDLIVDTLTHIPDPQTQYSALLLLSSLARLDPELIIHSMMPVFTFMGGSVLRHDDEHAKYVVDQIIDSIIPSLMASFKQQKGGALAGASGLISSFVAAFEHILPERRLDLFAALIDKLGAEDHLYVLLVFLQNHFNGKESAQSFINQIMSRYPANIQLRTVQHVLDMLTDSLEARPKLMNQIFASDEGQSHKDRCMLLARLPSELLPAPQLALRITKALHKDSQDARSIRSSYADMVQQSLTLSLSHRGVDELSSSIAATLGSLIGLFPVSESLRAMNTILQQSNEDLRCEVLRSFSNTIGKAHNNDVESRRACFELLPSLVTVLEVSEVSLVKENAMRCINGIIKKYGKIDPTKTLDIAQVIVGRNGLQYADPIVQVATLETLATMVNVLGEAVVPLCPQIVSKSLSHLQSSVQEDVFRTDVHNAVYGLFNSLLINLSWCLAGNQLDKFLELSYMSASTSPDKSCDAQRLKTLTIFAKHVAPKTCFEALERNWSRAVELAGPAPVEHLQVLELAIDKHAKSAIVANTDILTEHFINILDLRPTKLDQESEDWNEANVSEIEDRAFSILIRVIYKLNDTHFRPQFIRMSGWAQDIQSKEQIVAIRRLTSWSKFLHRFFDTLQSLATSYSNYVVDTAIEVLKAVFVVNDESTLLRQTTIQMLHAMFEHDQEDFWKSPSRFVAICEPLIAQLNHGDLLGGTDALISCITAFAVAVESPEHRADIHAKILQLFKSEDFRVRRAVFSCEISITEALGEEWIALFESSATYPVMSEAFEDDDEDVENEVRKWKIQIENMIGENLDSRLQ